MASAIDDTKPVAVNPTTQSTRDNFTAAKNEITALQADTATKLDLANTTDIAKGSALIGVYRNITGFVGRTLSTWIASRPFYGEDFGVVADWNGSTGTDNSAAITAAIAAATTGANMGRRVVLPSGSLKFDSTIVIPGGVTLEGEGAWATQCYFTNATPRAIAFDLGLSETAITTRPRIKKMNIRLIDDDLICVRLRCTAYALVEDIEMIAHAGLNTSLGVLVWGGNLSGFFNTFNNVYGNAIHKTIQFDSNTGLCTSQYFSNCGATNNKAVDATSVGVEFIDSNGLDSQFYGGNWESLGVGVQLSVTGGTDQTQGTGWYGVRFEANTVDLHMGKDASRNNFIACPNINVKTIDAANPDVGTIFLNNANFNGIPILSPPGPFGSENIAIGDSTSYNNMATDAGRRRNIALGQNVGGKITSGTNNMLVGVDCMDAANGSSNTVIGRSTLRVSTDAALSNHTVVGAFAGEDITSGDNCTLLGYEAGNSITTANNNIAVGYQAGEATSPRTLATTSNEAVFGDNNITYAGIKVAWTVTSDVRDKTDIELFSYGLKFIESINPITFRFDDRSRYDDGIPDGTKKDKRLRAGLSAQEILLIDNLGVVVDSTDKEKLTLNETALIPVLINAVKELSDRVITLEED